MQSKCDTLGKIIREARTNKNLTQDKAAEILEISPRHFQYIENDNKKPGYDLLCRLIHKLDISPVAIFYPQNEISNPELAGLFRKIRLCDQYQMSVINATTDALLKK